MRLTLSIVIIILFGNLLNAQIIQHKFSEPEKLGPNINTQAEECMPMISPDGSRLFFVRALYENNVGGVRGGQDIWVGQKNQENYSAATNSLGKLNNNGNNAVVGISSDGKTLYLLNSYKSGDKMKPGISESKLEGSSYAEPEDLDIPGLELNGDFYGFYMNPEGDTLLISMDGADSKGKEDIYVCLKVDGKWQKPINLGSQVNSFGYETTPFLYKDGKTLFYSSDGKGGYGEADIYVSERLDDTWTKWSYPRNLGKPLNSRGFDAYFMIDGKQAYFASNRDGDFSDIYVADYFRLLPGQKIKKDAPIPKTVYFKINDYMLYAEQKKILDEVIEILEDDDDLSVTLSGYTCDIGDNNTNEKLSELRAESVKTYLVIFGISESRITVKHFGEAEATEKNKTENDRELDRRVDIIFSY